jgi:hypothetical protein
MGWGLPLATIGGDLGQQYHFANGPGLEREDRQSKAIELEALCDKFYLPTRKQVGFLGDISSGTQLELETRDLSDPPPEKLVAMYAHGDEHDLFHWSQQLQVFRPDWIVRFNEGPSSNPSGKYNSSDCVPTTGSSGTRL